MSDALMHQTSDARRTALGTLLVERGYVDQEQVHEALRVGEETGERLGEVIVRLGWVSEDDLAKVLAEQWDLRHIERSAISFDGRALRRMTREDAARLEALPIQENEEGVVVVALAEPTDARLEALRTLLGDRIDIVVVARTAIETGLRSDLLASGGAEGSEATLEQAAHGSAFDAIATALTEGVAAQLEALRGLVGDAEARHERDRREIARLEAELADRGRAVRSVQQTLREYANALEFDE